MSTTARVLRADEQSLSAKLNRARTWAYHSLWGLSILSASVALVTLGMGLYDLSRGSQGLDYAAQGTVELMVMAGFILMSLTFSGIAFFIEPKGPAS